MIRQNSGVQAARELIIQLNGIFLTRVTNNKNVNGFQGSILILTLNDRQFGTRTDA